MGFLDFFRRENRQSAPYTDAMCCADHPKREPSGYVACGDGGG